MLNFILDVLNPSRRSESLYQEVLGNLKRAGAPRRSVDDLFAEFNAAVDEANVRIAAIPKHQ